MISRIIVGGHVGLGRYRANSEHTRLLRTPVTFQVALTVVWLVKNLLYSDSQLFLTKQTLSQKFCLCTTLITHMMQTVQGKRPQMLCSVCYTVCFWVGYYFWGSETG